MFDGVIVTPLRVYFHSLFMLAIILNLKFHILAKRMFKGIQKRIYDPMKHLGRSFFAKFEQI